MSDRGDMGEPFTFLCASHAHANVHGLAKFCASDGLVILVEQLAENLQPVVERFTRSAPIVSSFNDLIKRARSADWWRTLESNCSRVFRELRALQQLRSAHQADFALVGVEFGDRQQW